MKFLSKALLLFLFPLAVAGQDRDRKEQLAANYYERGLAKRTTQKDSSCYYFDLAYKLSYQIENYGDAFAAVVEAMITSADAYDLENQSAYLQKIKILLEEETIKSALAASDDLTYYQNRFLNDQANYLYKLKEYDAAKTKAMELRKRFVDKDVSTFDIYDLTHIVYSTHMLGAISMNTGKYDLAENYFNQALGFSAKNEMGKKRGLDRGTKRLFSQLYILTGNHEQADKVLSALLQDYKKMYATNREYKNSLITVYQRKVSNLIKQDSLQKAIIYLDESQEYLLEEDSFYKKSLLLYGDIHVKLGNVQRALEYYDSALDLYREFRQNKPHQDVAEVHGKIAKVFLEQDRYQDGLRSIQKAFENTGNNVKLGDYRANPDPKNVFSKTQLLQLLDIKLQLLSRNYVNSEEDEYLESALKTERDILKTFDLLKSEFDSKLDKQFLAEKAYPMFERMLDVAYMAYEKDGSEELLELALNISEKSKDFILMEALRSTQATQYGNVPQKILDKEAQLRAEITHLEKEIFDATNSESGFSDALFDLKQEYYSFLDTIKVKHPKYYELKYQNTPVELTKIRNKVLNDDTVLVSYSMTETNLYAIVLGMGHSNFLKLPFSEEDRAAIRDFYRLLSKPSINGSEEELASLGELFFEKVLKKPLEGLEAENLTIIPDGELHYLPFDLLRKSGSYLLKTKRIGYGNSVASLMELMVKHSFDKTKVLAFAPSFTDAVAVNPDRQFGKLLYNDDEVAKIKTFYTTETVTDQNATLESFRAKTRSDFNVVHLATHASANDEYPDYSYLAFSQQKDSSHSNVLYIKDLYNTTLNADMVTLSACQTGIGKLQKGQGMLSLSKGFYYAGAKSLVNTLWKINDKSTVTLMDYFYEGLSKGKSKTEALRNAKIKYLETTEDNLLRHPYYWAAFVVSGDVSPITEKNDWVYWAAGVLTVSLLGFLLAKRKPLFPRG